LHRQIGAAGRIYNHCIALHKRYYKLTGKKLNQYALMKHLTKLKKLPRYADWNCVGSQAIQDIVQRIDRAYTLFFRNLERGIKTAPPGFKKVVKYKSFTLKQAGYRLLDGNRIYLQGQIYKFAKSREIDGNIKTLTVKRDQLGNLYLYFAVETETQNEAPKTGKSAGFDFGLKTFLTGSDGMVIESPLFYRRALKDVRKAHGRLSWKVKGSHNRQLAKDHLNRVYQRIDNLRQDFFFKLAHELTDKYDQLFFETLNLKGMKRLWGRKVSDLAFRTFLNILCHVADAKGKVVHFIDRFYSSSKTCSDCGHVYQDLNLRQRIWACPGCGVIHDRDLNAAVNIYREGASSLGVGEVSLALSSICC
jgi:putative transposase